MCYPNYTTDYPIVKRDNTIDGETTEGRITEKAAVP